MYDDQIVKTSLDPRRPARGLALYDWGDDFDVCKHPELLVRLVENLGVEPRHLEFGFPGRKKKRPRITRKTDLLQALSLYDSYSYISVDEPIDGNYFNLDFGLGFSLFGGCQLYQAQKDAKQWSVFQAIEHVRLISEFISPAYGFSHVMPTSFIGIFQGGTGSSSMPGEVNRRADALADMISPTGSRAHLTGGLHDVYELNILSTAHLEREALSGRSLATWIASGDHGELIKVTDNVHLWHVPEKQLSFIRMSFLSAGLLLVPG